MVRKLQLTWRSTGSARAILGSNPQYELVYNRELLLYDMELVAHISAGRWVLRRATAADLQDAWSILADVVTVGRGHQDGGARGGREQGY